jgi:hypothetical protein
MKLERLVFYGWQYLITLLDGCQKILNNKKTLHKTCLPRGIGNGGPNLTVTSL